MQPWKPIWSIEEVWTDKLMLIFKLNAHPVIDLTVHLLSSSTYANMFHFQKLDYVTKNLYMEILMYLMQSTYSLVIPNEVWLFLGRVNVTRNKYLRLDHISLILVG